MRDSDSVESMSGAPRIAPTPISWLTSTESVPANRASNGTMLSGMAVPTAANSDPVTPSEIRSRSPRCSRALVKTSAATRMRASIAQRCKAIVNSMRDVLSRDGHSGNAGRASAAPGPRGSLPGRDGYRI